MLLVQYKDSKNDRENNNSHVEKQQKHNSETILPLVQGKQYALKMVEMRNIVKEK